MSFLLLHVGFPRGFLFAKPWAMCKNRRMSRNWSAILGAIPYDFPVKEQPYMDIARQAGMGQDELIRALQDMKAEGLIRRIAAVLYHRKAAYLYNAMVVWEVDEDEVESIGRIMARFPEVSHCYERERGGYWSYNVFTMIHSQSLEGCHETVRRIAEATGIRRYRVFFSKREFKKTSLMVGNE